MIDEPVAVGVLADRDDVAGLVARYNLLAVPVVDDENRLVGIVTVDDAIDTILPASRRRRGTRAVTTELGPTRCGSRSPGCASASPTATSCACAGGSAAGAASWRSWPSWARG